MPQIISTEYGYEQYNVNLQGDENTGFQWNIVLDRIVDEDAGHKVYRVKNRSWEKVGPEFETREQGSRYLGYDHGKSGDVRQHWADLVAEYQQKFSDEVETIDNITFELRKFGRPSTGRDRRLQFSATATLEAWLESQKIGKESLSQTTFRLLEELRNRNANREASHSAHSG